jgi:hypothetical protein
MTDGGTEIAAFQTVGSNRLTVIENHGGAGYVFRITGRSTRAHTVMIADHEAVALAETILERNR